MPNDPLALPSPPLLRVSCRLARAMEQVAGLASPPATGGRSDGFGWETPKPPFDPAVQAEARDAMEELAPFAVAASPAVVAAWLEPLPFAVKKPPPCERLSRWMDAVMRALGSIELGAFNEQTQRQALEQIEFWPAPAQIYEIVLPAAIAIRVQLAMLRRIADGVSAPIFPG